MLNKISDFDSDSDSTHFGVCFVLSQIIRHTEAIIKECQQELYKILIFNQRLHISSSVNWPLLLNM